MLAIGAIRSHLGPPFAKFVVKYQSFSNENHFIQRHLYKQFEGLLLCTEIFDFHFLIFLGMILHIFLLFYMLIHVYSIIFELLIKNQTSYPLLSQMISATMSYMEMAAMNLYLTYCLPRLEVSQKM